MKLPHMLIVAAYCAFLFWMSSGPVSTPSTIQFDGVDKVAHACVYSVLAGLVFFGMRQSGRPWTPRALFCIPVLFVAFYGASDEFHQYFIPSRNCDFFDWLADVTGALAAASLLPLCLRLLRKLVPETLPVSGE